MEYDKIKQLMEEMSNSKLTELEIEFPEGTKISMKKNEVYSKCNENTIQNNLKQEVLIEQKPVENKEKVRNGNIVKSPMVGTFYSKPSPEANPYVEIGKEVKMGETLCIIEAMKLMNEIESEFSGTIKEILVKDGEAVEFGKELFVIE